MSLFNSILEKLGFDHPGAKAAGARRPGPDTSTVLSAPQAAPRTPSAPQDVPQIDVMAKLEGMAAASSQTLNWKTSIVDLLKLLGLDSSFSARKELATELGCPADKMDDSAQMNVWLHKAVLQQLAENGGNVPKELLH